MTPLRAKYIQDLVIRGGALSPDGKQWRSPKQRKFLFPVRALAALFRGEFLAGLAQMLDAEELHLPDLELQIPANRARWFSLLGCVATL